MAPVKKYSAADELQILGTASRKELGPEFSVLVWNIFKAKMRGWEVDFQAMTDSHDLVLLQESVLHTKYDALFQKPDKKEWIMALSHRISPAKGDTGVKTGSAAQSSGQKFFVSPHVEPIFKTPKLLLATTYKLKASMSDLLVINIHAINFVSAKKYMPQIQQIAEAIGYHDGPVILAGDFNTWNALRFKHLRDVAGTMGLEEVLLERKGRLRHFNQHLDHVFYRGITLESAGILSHIKTSDHFPITARFRVKESH